MIHNLAFSEPFVELSGNTDKSLLAVRNRDRNAIVAIKGPDQREGTCKAKPASSTSSL